ncbi:MAG: fumarylacetoacetate hydrolase family protein [Pseudoruegeria sp.]
MSEFVLTPPAIPSVAIAESAKRFAVRRIFCVGRNYAEHAREMGDDPDREPPFFFCKPADAVVDDGVTLPFPMATENLHHEAELVVALASGGADILPEQALSCVWGYGVGNDLTRRDLQAAGKEKRRPWDMGKGFDDSAACGPLHPVTEIGHPGTGRITAEVDGVLKQDGDLAEMIWPVADIIAHLSGLVTLAAGDLIYTGTPAGVGPIQRGQTCRITVQGLGAITTTYR